MEGGLLLSYHNLQNRRSFAADQKARLQGLGTAGIESEEKVSTVTVKVRPCTRSTADAAGACRVVRKAQVSRRYHSIDRRARPALLSPTGLPRRDLLPASSRGRGTAGRARAETGQDSRAGTCGTLACFSDITASLHIEIDRHWYAASQIFWDRSSIENAQNSTEQQAPGAPSLASIGRMPACLLYSLAIRSLLCQS